MVGGHLAEQAAQRRAQFWIANLAGLLGHPAVECCDLDAPHGTGMGTDLGMGCVPVRVGRKPGDTAHTKHQPIDQCGWALARAREAAGTSRSRPPFDPGGERAIEFVEDEIADKGQLIAHGRGSDAYDEHPILQCFGACVGLKRGANAMQRLCEGQTGDRVEKTPREPQTLKRREQQSSRALGECPGLAATSSRSLGRGRFLRHGSGEDSRPFLANHVFC